VPTLDKKQVVFWLRFAANQLHQAPVWSCLVGRTRLGFRQDPDRVSPLAGCLADGLLPLHLLNQVLHEVSLLPLVQGGREHREEQLLQLLADGTPELAQVVHDLPLAVVLVTALAVDVVGFLPGHGGDGCRDDRRGFPALDQPSTLQGPEGVLRDGLPLLHLVENDDID
jgi:hypothetical protein